jgi:hypothetical protein
VGIEAMRLDVSRPERREERREFVPPIEVAGERRPSRAPSPFPVARAQPPSAAEYLSTEYLSIGPV